MKSFVLALSLTIMTVSAQAAKLTPLLALEKGSHRLDALFKKSEVDQSFKTDIYYVSVLATAQGYTMTWYSPSNDQNHSNSITMLMGADGKVSGQTVDFVQASANGPIFTKTDTATLFDLGTEAVVDHLDEAAELSEVAAKTVSVQMSNANGQVVLQIKLDDGRIYTVVLDQDGNFISRGF